MDKVGLKRILLILIIMGAACMNAGCSFVVKTGNNKKEKAVVPDMEIVTEYKEEDILHESENLYVYQQLMSQEKALYDLLYTALINRVTAIDISKYSNQNIQEIYESIRQEHSEIFWVEGYEIKTTDLGQGEVVKILYPTYIMREGEIELIQRKIDQTTKELQDKTVDMNDYEKTKYLFSWVCENTTYRAGKNDQNISSVFFEQESVCQGYALAYQYLLTQSGIKSFVVRGINDGQLHAWVAAKIGNEWYYSDPTLGDAQIQLSDRQFREFIDYSYLDMTEEECAKTHYSVSTVKLPKSKSLWNGYLNKERLYFSIYDDLRVGERIQEEYNKADYIILKFGSYEERQRAVEDLMVHQALSNWIPNEKVTYLTNKDRLIIFFN